MSLFGRFLIVLVAMVGALTAIFGWVYLWAVVLFKGHTLSALAGACGPVILGFAACIAWAWHQDNI